MGWEDDEKPREVLTDWVFSEEIYSIGCDQWNNETVDAMVKDIKASYVDFNFKIITITKNRYEIAGNGIYEYSIIYKYKDKG